MARHQRWQDALRRRLRLQQDRCLRHRRPRERHLRPRRRERQLHPASPAAARAASSWTKPRGRLYVTDPLRQFRQGHRLSSRHGDPGRRRCTIPSRRRVVRGRPLLYDATRFSGNGEAVLRQLPHLRRHGRPRLGPRQPRHRRHPKPHPHQPRRAALHPDLLPKPPASTRPINGSDKLADFHPMKGPMTTQTLRGLRDSRRHALARRPLHRPHGHRRHSTRSFPSRISSWRSRCSGRHRRCPVARRNAGLHRFRPPGAAAAQPRPQPG